MGSQVTLYVRSSKTATGTKQVGGYKTIASNSAAPVLYGFPPKPYTYYDVETKVEYDYMLPEEQQKIVEDAKELSPKYGVDLTIVDLTKDKAFSRWRLEHSKKIKTLPALVSDTGEIIEGVMTREQIEAFLYNIGKSASRMAH